MIGMFLFHNYLYFECHENPAYIFQINLHYIFLNVAHRLASHLEDKSCNL